MIQSALIAILRSQITSATYANAAPQNTTLPAITVDQNSNFRNRHFSAGRTTTGIQETDFEISVWATTPEAASQTGKSVVDLLENFAGPLTDGNSPQNTYRVTDIDVTSELDGFDRGSKMYEYSIFITIKHAGEQP